MRALWSVVLLLLVAGCAKPPTVDTFIASPIPGTSTALHSPNGQRQALLIRFGARWHGHIDDTFAATSFAVFAGTDDGAAPGLVFPEDPEESPVDLSGWKPLTEIPLLIVEAWAAGDPALRAPEATSLVAMLRLPGTSSAARAITASLASELAAAAGLPDPGIETIEDPGLIASRVAVEAAARAVINEDTGEADKLARIAILQILVFLNNRFLAVEHFTFEAHGGSAAGVATSWFSMHDLETGVSIDRDVLLDHEKQIALAGLVSAPGRLQPDGPAVPDDWYPSRPGIVLFYRTGSIAPGERGAVRLVVPWKKALSILPSDSPLREIAESIH